MSNEIRPKTTEPNGNSSNAQQTYSALAAKNGAFLRAKNLFRKRLEIVGSALERAEKRIMENFRVPPNGG
jgi:hypothetical protein